MIFDDRNDLRLMLWAGDCVHDDITDVERLPNFDIYLCRGDYNMVEKNEEYLSTREAPGLIYIVDVTVEEQLAEFIKLFANRFSVIDSDYNGNTPTLPVEVYAALLSKGGKAYNIEGIQESFMPVEEFQNTLEIFAPVLPVDLRDRRYFTEEMVELAIENNLPTSMAWASPDLMDAYYSGIRDRQLQFMDLNKDRNPMGHSAKTYDDTTIEYYWEYLPLRILMTNFTRAKHQNQILGHIVNTYSERFCQFLISLIEPYMSNLEEFHEYIQGLDSKVNKLQEIYRLCIIGNVEFGYYVDTRYTEYKMVYGHWLTG